MIGLQRTILHVDMNSFFAGVECQRDPSLRAYPMAVCGDVDERHGIILAKNDKAKAFGIQTGEAAWQAKQKCRELMLVLPHYELYMKASRSAREIYERYTDLVEPFGIDECWLDVTGSRRFFGTGETIANAIRERVRTELGLTVSVGVSFNKVFAKLGSDMKKPDAVTVISEENFKEKIWNLPASDLLGVGRATGKKLASVGIRTIGDVANWPRDFFERRLGKGGAAIWDFANGLDISPVTVRDTEAVEKSCGHGITTLQDLESDDEVWKVILELSQEIGHRLYVYRKKATGISVSVRNSNLYTKQWQGKLEMATQSASCIAKEAFSLFCKSYRWEHTIRSVTVTAIGLCPLDAPFQVGLFYDMESLHRREAIDRCIEELRSRFGNRIVRHAGLLDNPKMPTWEHSNNMPNGMQL